MKFPIEKKQSQSQTISQKKIFSEEILTRLQNVFPDAHCELFYKTPFQLLVSVVLSAQTTDKTVNKVMTPIYENGFDPETVLEMSLNIFREQIKSIGLANTKAKNILTLAKILVEKHNSMPPKTRLELEALPGVGRKTANVVLAEIFQQPTLAVDTHVFRVTGRLGLHKEKTPEKCELRLLKLIDPKFLPNAHHLFIFQGRYICTARSPKCEACTLTDLCQFYKKSLKKTSRAS